MQMQIKLEDQNYYLGMGDQTLIRNGNLLDLLLKENDLVITKLSDIISPITLDKVIIDETGNIIITDASFRAKVESRLNAPGGIGLNALCANLKSCFQA